MKYVSTALIVFFCSTFYGAFAQAPSSSSFGGYNLMEIPTAHDEMPKSFREAIIKELKANTADLKARGIIKEIDSKKVQVQKFTHPLRQAAGFTDPGYYGISNFVDVDPTAGVKDYNCGNRTYNDHMGTDYFTFPFWWEKMDENAVEVIAAADGVIIARQDGKYDKNCQNCAVDAPNSCYFWNTIYVRNNDGTICWYGHMKSGSLSTKSIGSTVVQGEYLGVVGSSGNSSGPHLHLEVWNNDTYTQLINPWAGTCNTEGNASYFQNQEPYYNTMVAKVMTAANIPVFADCVDVPKPEKSYKQNTFNIGETVYVPVFIRDNVKNHAGYKLKLIRPNGVAFYDWTLANYEVNYSWLWFYYSFDKTVLNIPGEWKFSVSYGGDPVIHTFTMLSPMPLKLTSFTAQKDNERVKLQWQTQEETNTDRFEIERGNDGVNFSKISEMNTTGNNQTSINNYDYNDETPRSGSNFYRLKMIDKDGQFTYSNINEINFANTGRATLFPNPAKDYISIKNVNQFKTVSIIDYTGKILLEEKISAESKKMDISTLPAGIYLVQLKNATETQNIKLIKK